jgi:hypothetical protein
MGLIVPSEKAQREREQSTNQGKVPPITLVTNWTAELKHQ